MKRSAIFPVLVLITTELTARIISYAPVTDRYAVPAVQNRAARHYLLMEAETAAPLYFDCQILCVPGYSERRGQFVLYDFSGANQPRVLLPGSTPEPTLKMAALWEEEYQKPRILVLTDARVNGDNPDRFERLLYSRDGGDTWKVITFAPGSTIPRSTFFEDVGGPFVRARGSQVRIGNAEMPFVFTVHNDGVKTSRVYGLLVDGTPKRLADMMGNGEHPCCGPTSIVGSDIKGRKFLITGSPRGIASPANRLWILDAATLDLRDSGEVDKQRAPLLDGWITPERNIYLEDRGLYGSQKLWFIQGGVKLELGSAPTAYPPDHLRFIAVPTHDYRGGWIIKRGHSDPTVLLRHIAGAAPVEQWSDLTGPKVEALHTDSEGERLLVQVHRDRPLADQRLFIDPALAIWKIGNPAPREYDELYLIEGPGKAFVHLDVDFVAEGGTFVFDGASITEPPPPPAQISPAPGGGDVVQEWGVVRSSLTQRLVLPGIARVSGMHGSVWRTDLIMRNPSDKMVSVAFRFVSNAVGEPVRHLSMTLGAEETRTIPDIVSTLFGLEEGGGALFITPEMGFAISVTSRSYSQSDAGTFGTMIPASEIFASAAPRFPVTFAGAFQGPEFRTNVLVTDTSSAGTGIFMRYGPGQLQHHTFSGVTVEPGSETQFNSVQTRLNLAASETGSLLFQPTTGEAIASVVVIDNRTNDPNWFPPDLPAPYVRTIPLIAHVDDGVLPVRSDLFLYNNSDESRWIILLAKPWNSGAQESRLQMNFAPRESVVLRDVLFTKFNMVGLARLRYQSGDPSEPDGIRVTSRTYATRADGGTFGQVIPALNSFQAAAAGDTLEILGGFGDEKYRTDLSLVDLGAFANPTPVRVKIEMLDHRGVTIDSFETEVATAGGKRLDDLFRARGLGIGMTAGGVIRVSPFGGMVGAFASVTDRRTGDPMYLGAALGSR